ncbi:protein PHLOEM PROTEIN 2-LIKE A5-like [Abrus precatorius]|uniref:ADP-ribosyl cyclase/cyclic ADP-ribose hydrolase n=1 Tax=Abrus precatorius TaxID=3816 RepID=A0A8B8MIM7_ABRPR|nr:protein PHLOEM PROTEIN 2-LIKE A5-like [Abrus precatorius]
MANEGNTEHKPKWLYDVFLCFRGEDTRHTFAGNLYNALTHKRFNTFMDHERLKTGDHISFIHEALQHSMISIVILSKDFASSTYCLDEIVKILECRKQKNQLVLPIFYDVDPSDVSCESETSRFKEAVSNFRERFAHDLPKLNTWRSTLSRLAQPNPIYGQWQFKNERKRMNELKGCLYFCRKQYEYERIEMIVEWVTKNVPRCDVFLSFREKDTRYPFIDFLHNALLLERFKINMHDEASEDLDQISQSLIESIERSWLLVVVLSENFAYSSSCLDELVTILECKKKKNQLVWPIFYKVEPSDLRHQRNSYAEAMAEQENNFGKDSEKVQKWRSALFEVANMKGSHLKTGYEYEIIEKIVKVAINAMYIRSS